MICEQKKNDKNMMTIKLWAYEGHEGGQKSFKINFLSNKNEGVKNV